MSDSAELLTQLQQQLEEAQKTLKSMKGGCGCNSKGRAANQARRDFINNTINPLKQQIKDLINSQATEP